jgi:hypothetical protein
MLDYTLPHAFVKTSVLGKLLPNRREAPDESSNDTPRSDVTNAMSAKSRGPGVPIFHPYLGERRVANQDRRMRQGSANPLPGKQTAGVLAARKPNVLAGLPPCMGLGAPQPISESVMSVPLRRSHF